MRAWRIWTMNCGSFSLHSFRIDWQAPDQLKHEAALGHRNEVGCFAGRHRQGDVSEQAQLTAFRFRVRNETRGERREFHRCDLAVAQASSKLLPAARFVWMVATAAAPADCAANKASC